MDIHLDDMSGLEVCRLIKEDPKTQNIPIILISGTANAIPLTNGHHAWSITVVKLLAGFLIAFQTFTCQKFIIHPLDLTA